MYLLGVGGKYYELGKIIGIIIDTHTHIEVKRTTKSIGIEVTETEKWVDLRMYIKNIQIIGITNK